MAKKDELNTEITAEKKDQLLNEALKTIEKQYGKGSIMKLGEHAFVDVDAISTGS
jgi:recombination protein RecA